MQHFQIEARVGEGSFSEVFRVRRKQDGEVYALKKIKMSHLSKAERLNCVNEVRLLSHLKHPNVLQYKEAFFDQKYLCLVTEYAQNGDFLNYMMKRKKNRENLSEQEICATARQMLNGIQALHRLNIIHRDIKAANFLLASQGRVKLADMNVSSISNCGMAQTKIGTPYYNSPQIWKERPYDTKIDMWAFGCLLYEMVTYLHPFRGKDLPQLKRNILAGKYESLPETCSPQIRCMIERCLSLDPQERPSARQLLESKYLKQKYLQFKQKTMEKVVVSERQNQLVFRRILKEIKGNQSVELNIQRSLPRSNYQEKQQNNTQQSRGKQNSHQVISKSSKRPMNLRILTMISIYSQKAPSPKHPWKKTAKRDSFGLIR